MNGPNFIERIAKWLIDFANILVDFLGAVGVFLGSLIAGIVKALRDAGFIPESIDQDAANVVAAFMIVIIFTIVWHPRWVRRYPAPGATHRGFKILRWHIITFIIFGVMILVLIGVVSAAIQIDSPVIARPGP